MKYCHNLPFCPWVVPVNNRKSLFCRRYCAHQGWRNGGTWDVGQTGKIKYLGMSATTGEAKINNTNTEMYKSENRTANTIFAWYSLPGSTPVKPVDGYTACAFSCWISQVWGAFRALAKLSVQVSWCSLGMNHGSWPNLRATNWIEPALACFVPP